PPRQPIDLQLADHIFPPASRHTTCRPVFSHTPNQPGRRHLSPLLRYLHECHAFTLPAGRDYWYYLRLHAISSLYKKQKKRLLGGRQQSSLQCLGKLASSPTPYPCVPHHRDLQHYHG
ncbi:unnamed protein product, partial [Ectocarpus sp. 8 AP-2014]